MLASVRLYLVHLDSACLKCFKTSARNSVQHKKAVLHPFLRSAPHSKTFAQMCTTITLLNELKLQKHLNACLRKVVTRTLERFLNLNVGLCPIYFAFDFSFNSANGCACHVIITFRALWSEVASTSGRFNLKEIFTLKIKISKLQQQYPNGENLIKQLFHSRLLDMRLVI